jgi:hypothetical protein
MLNGGTVHKHNAAVKYYTQSKSRCERVFTVIFPAFEPSF